MLYIDNIKKFSFKNKYHLVDTSAHTDTWVSKKYLKRLTKPKMVGETIESVTVRGYIRHLNHVFNYSDYIDYFNMLGKETLKRILVGITNDSDDKKNKYYFVFSNPSIEVRYGLNPLIDSSVVQDKNIGLVYKYFNHGGIFDISTHIFYRVKKLLYSRYYKLDFGDDMFSAYMSFTYNGLYFKDNNFYCCISSDRTNTVSYINLFNFYDCSIVKV